MSLTRLVYFSMNRLPAGEPASIQLKRILETAIRNNNRLAVTGGLVFNRTYFLQVLEGDRSAVTAVFAAISRDPRHDQVELVETKAVGKRLFGAWSMGFAATPDLLNELWAAFHIQGPFNPKVLTSDQITRLILELVKKEDNFVSSRNVRATEAELG